MAPVSTKSLIGLPLTLVSLGLLGESTAVLTQESPGPIILHLCGPSFFKGSGQDLVISSPFSGVAGAFSLPVSLLFAYDTLIQSCFLGLLSSVGIRLTGVGEFCGWLI